jgi:hypothetical protein
LCVFLLQTDFCLAQVLPSKQIIPYSEYPVYIYMVQSKSLLNAAFNTHTLLLRSTHFQFSYFFLLSNLLFSVYHISILPTFGFNFFHILVGICENVFFSLRWEFGKHFENRDKDNFLSLTGFFTGITICNTSNRFRVDQQLPVPSDIKHTFSLVSTLVLNYHNHPHLTHSICVSTQTFGNTCHHYCFHKLVHHILCNFLSNHTLHVFFNAV